MATTPYTTLTFAVLFDGTDDALELAIRGLGALADMEIARIEVTTSPDDGQRVKLSCRLDQEQALVAMHQLVAMTDIVRPVTAKMHTSMHDEPFDDQALWPSEHVAMSMESKGVHRLNVDFNVDPWFPHSLVQSLVAEALTTLLRPDPLDQVHGVSTDRTLPGFPSFGIWVEEETYHTLQDRLVPTVEGWIEELALNPHLRRWLTDIHDLLEADDEDDTRTA